MSTYFWFSSLGCFHVFLLPSQPLCPSKQSETVAWALVCARSQITCLTEVSLSTDASTCLSVCCLFPDAVSLFIGLT